MRKRAFNTPAPPPPPLPIHSPELPFRNLTTQTLFLDLSILDEMFLQFCSLINNL